MKALKIISMLIATILLLNGCKKEPVTYRFTEEDKLKLLPHYIEGEIFTFENEIGEERKFKMMSESLYTRQEYTPNGMYVADDMYFYFEEKRIALMDLADQEQIIIKLRHYPINREEAISNIYKKYKSHLTGFIYGYYTSFYFFDIVYENEKKGIQINDMVYSNTLELLNDTYQYNKGILGISSVIYYDIYQGIIGFDDINGHQWRLKNN